MTPAIAAATNGQITYEGRIIERGGARFGNCCRKGSGDKQQSHHQRASSCKLVTGNIAETLCANRVERNLPPNRDWTDPIGNLTTSSVPCVGTPWQDCTNHRTASNQQKSKCDSRHPAKIDFIYVLNIG